MIWSILLSPISISRFFCYKNLFKFQCRPTLARSVCKNPFYAGFISLAYLYQLKSKANGLKLIDVHLITAPLAGSA